VSYRVRTCNAQICSLAANVTSFSDLFSLVTVTPTDVLKIRPVSVRVRLGAQTSCPRGLPSAQASGANRMRSG